VVLGGVRADQGHSRMLMPMRLEDDLGLLAKQKSPEADLVVERKRSQWGP